MVLENKIESVKIQGFRSLVDVELNDLPNAAVLIGPNGSGKSNFVRFFEMLSWMLRSRRLQEFVALRGGADDQLFGGNAITSRLAGEVSMRTSDGRNDYRFALAHADGDRFIFTHEQFRFTRHTPYTTSEAAWQPLGSAHEEARIVEVAQGSGYPGANQTTARVIVNLLRNCAVFQFHDTSESSNFKNKWDVYENHQLRSHGGNLAAVLYRLEHEDLRRYELICQQIGRVLPGFDRFAIEEDYDRVLLRWKPKWSDKTIGPHLTSDGSLRFFALVTLLNLPPQMLPDVIMLDEPELGLHPSAIALLGGLIKSLSVHKQVIVATQSPLLVDSFDLDQIHVLNLKNGQTKVTRPDKEEFQHWLEEFSTGQLWQTNILGGRP